MICLSSAGSLVRFQVEKFRSHSRRLPRYAEITDTPLALAVYRTLRFERQRKLRALRRSDANQEGTRGFIRIGSIPAARKQLVSRTLGSEATRDASAVGDARFPVRRRGETVGAHTIASDHRSSTVSVVSDPGTAEPTKQFSAGAMCVQRFNDRFVLRFTFFLAVRFGLPRPASLVIHRSELCTRSWSNRRSAYRETPDLT